MDVVRRLDQFLAAQGWATADLARATGLAHSTLSKIRAGHRSAGLSVALRIQDVTADWSEGPIRIDEWRAAKIAAGQQNAVSSGKITADRAAHIESVRKRSTNLPPKRRKRAA